jgi:hypothetical protein
MLIAAAMDADAGMTHLSKWNTSVHDAKNIAAANAATHMRSKANSAVSLPEIILGDWSRVLFAVPKSPEIKDSGTHINDDHPDNPVHLGILIDYGLAPAIHHTRDRRATDSLNSVG